MRASDRRGFALPAAIGGLVIVGLLVTAGFYMARQEVRIGVASKHAAMAVNVAQMGANEVMANWNGYQLGQVPLWRDTTISDNTETGLWTVKVTNLNGKVYFLDATGEVTEGGALWSGATRRIGLVTRIIYANIDPPAALTTRGTTKLKGNSEVHGEDSDPSAWGGYCTTSKDKPGVVTNDTTGLSTTGGATISGSPPYQQDVNIVDSTFTNFGNMDWAQLVDVAKADGKDATSLIPTINQTLPDSTGTTCNTATLTNWGDPRDPAAACGAYFPLVYIGGDVTIQSGGFGQGVLLVDGNLDLRGNFEFYGIIIVQGALGVQGSGNRVWGGVMASNADFDPQSLTGGAVVTNSTCAVQRSILNNAALSRARPLQARSWIDLSSLSSN